jgi:nitroreductase
MSESSPTPTSGPPAIAYHHVDECRIAAPAHECFELVLAVRRYAEWWQRIGCEPLGPEGRLRVGSRFRFSGGPVRWIIEVRGLVPYRRIDLEYVEGDLLGPVCWEFLADGTETRVRYAYRGVRPNSEYTRASFASGRSLALHSQVMQEDAFAGLRRILEGGGDPTGSDLFETLHTQRAVRRFRADPVPDAVLRHVLEAATRAPSARNAQPWHFVAVRDPALRARLAGIYLAVWDQARTHTERTDADADIKHRPGYGAMMQHVDELAHHLADVPVFMLACLDTRLLGPLVDESGQIRSPLAAYASILPAVQNLMLAARGLGLGTTLTTLATSAEAAVRDVVALPSHFHVAALLPLGYPERRFRPTRRRPLAEVASLDRYGEPLSSE